MDKENYTLEQIIEESFDFSDYSEDEKTKLIAETSSMIMEVSLLRALDSAPEEIQDKFEALLKTEPSEEEMADFIKENFPNFADIVVEEIRNFQKLSAEKQAEAEAKAENEEAQN